MGRLKAPVVPLDLQQAVHHQPDGQSKQDHTDAGPRILVHEQVGRPHGNGNKRRDEDCPDHTLKVDHDDLGLLLALENSQAQVLDERLH